MDCKERCEWTTFSDRMIPEIVQTFWAGMARGEFITDAAAQAGTYRKKGTRWLAAGAPCGAQHNQQHGR